MDMSAPGPVPVLFIISGMAPAPMAINDTGSVALQYLPAPSVDGNPAAANAIPSIDDIAVVFNLSSMDEPIGIWA